MSKILTLTAVLLVAVAEGADVSPQLASIAAQQASIGRQQAAIAGQQGVTDRQTANADTQVKSAERQRVSVKKQEELVPVWQPPVPSAALMPPALALPDKDCAPLSAQEADGLINSAADQEDVPASLLRAVIRQESGFKPCAVSQVGAEGLMQLMPETAYDLHVKDPFDPQQNLRGGAAYLKQLMNRYGGDLERALGAYNAGMGRVDAADGIPAIDETKNYVSSIMRQLGYTQASAHRSGFEMPSAKDDFHRLTLPPASSVFSHTPDFSRFR